MFKNLLIKEKLIIFFTIMIFFLMIISSLSIYYVVKIRNEEQALYEHPYAVSVAAIEIDSDIRKIYNIMQNIIILTDKTEISSAELSMDDIELEIEANINILADKYLGKESEIITLVDIYNQSKVIRRTVINFVLDDDAQSAIAFLQSSGTSNKILLENQILVIENFAKDKAAETNQAAYHYSKVSMFIVIGISAISILFSWGLFVYFIQDLLPPLKKLLNTIESFKKGENINDLDLSRKDELGIVSNSFDDMLLFMKTEREVNELKLRLNNLKDKENLRITLMSIGDGVITTDSLGIITNINPVASRLIEIDPIEAIGKETTDVFNIINKTTRLKIENPIKKVLIEGKIFGLANHTVLISKSGKEYDIADSAAPIIGENGEVYGVIIVFRDVTKEYKKQREIENLNYHDVLTGLFNRRYVEKEIKCFNNADNFPISIIVADINGLKLVNDAFGHLAGDELIKKAANVLKSTSASTDYIARMGGDEFLIYMPNTIFKEAEKRLAQIQHMCKKIFVNSMELSIALGISTKESNEISYENLYKNAEDAMYRMKLLASPSMRSAAIDTILQTLFEKNPATELHSRNVSKYAERLARAADYGTDFIQEVKTIGLLHDIGKIIIPTTILTKEGKLTIQEYEEMKKHSEIGFRILNATLDMRKIATYVLYHHEKIDGTGYPQGLKGDEIPIQSKIITIVDSFDAMIHKRKYKAKMSIEQAIFELKRCSGTQFDPHLVDIFISNIETIVK